MTWASTYHMSFLASRVGDCYYGRDPPKERQSPLGKVPWFLPSSCTTTFVVFWNAGLNRNLLCSTVKASVEDAGSEGCFYLKWSLQS